MGSVWDETPFHSDVRRRLKFIPINAFLLLQPGFAEGLQLLRPQPPLSGQRRLPRAERQEPGGAERAARESPAGCRVETHNQFAFGIS